MDHSVLKESLVVCENRLGQVFHGTILRLRRHDIVFQIATTDAILRATEVLDKFTIRLHDQVVYSGRAVLRGMVHTGVTEVCEASLDGHWLEVESPGAETDPEALGLRFRAFLGEWQKHYRVLPEFKILVADMESLLSQLRLWLEQVELGLSSGPEAEAEERAHALARQLGPTVSGCIDSLWERFSNLTERIEPDAHPAHRAHLRRVLHPLLLCSPFAHRSYHKPLGYAGDYEIVNMIARDPYEGGSLFARIINHWLLQQSPSVAHRNRLDYLNDRLVAETVRRATESRPLRAFSLACGPALEVQRFLAEQDLSSRAHVTLLDFNEQTLEHTRRALGDLRSRHKRATQFEFVRKSVQQLLKDAVRPDAPAFVGRYDFVYCAGLFDYLSDSVCQRLMAIAYQWLAPGGLLLVTNVDAARPIHLSLDYMLDWPILCRDAAHLREMTHAVFPNEPCVVKADDTGVNLIVEVQRPHAE